MSVLEIAFGVCLGMVFYSLLKGVVGGIIEWWDEE